MHPKISIILDLGEHVDVDNDPEKAGESDIIMQCFEMRNELLDRLCEWKMKPKPIIIMMTTTTYDMLLCPPEDNPHAPDDQPIELEAPVTR